MEDAHTSGARCRTPLPCNFSPIHLPENAIFEDDEDDDDDEDLSPLEPPPSLVAQAPSWCTRREGARGERQVLRASNPLETGARFRPASRRHAAPSDPGPATSKVATDPGPISSAESTGPRVRVVGFGPFPKPSGHPRSVSPAFHRGTSPAARQDPARQRQRFSPQLSTTKEKPGVFSALGRSLDEPLGLRPSPVTARSDTVDEPENGSAKWPRIMSADNTESQGSNTSSTITLPADLARPPIPDTYKRPKVATLDTPVFGCRPFYLSSTLESRRATTIARREVERQLPPLPRAGEPRQRAGRFHRGSAEIASDDGVGMTRGAGGGGGGVARGQMLEAWRRGAAAAAHKPFFIDDVLRGGDDNQPKKRRAAAANGSAVMQAETNTDTNTTGTGTGSQKYDDGKLPSPVGEGRETPHRSVTGGEGATSAPRALNDHPSSPPGKVPEGSEESLKRLGSSSSLLSFLLNQESGRAGR
ncbi:hypothetical protein MAPG_02139 [Magnaporthiopsis poae ATCC 64411]|uniref:Uncharacterized protein n=1 Tax=Magnaporthiopsis poae (strain ATCC 64411 / 73-15) TaxID=644358 RepID=A0A0C4DQJ5_MAGP6|nr:hypothetical protein MAPG_02139 [Magnaporthiopsis poae ATCC 64411]